MCRTTPRATSRPRACRACGWPASPPSSSSSSSSSSWRRGRTLTRCVPRARRAACRAACRRAKLPPRTSAALPLACPSSCPVRTEPDVRRLPHQHRPCFVRCTTLFHFHSFTFTKSSAGGPAARGGGRARHLCGAGRRGGLPLPGPDGRVSAVAGCGGGRADGSQPAAARDVLHGRGRVGGSAGARGVPVAPPRAAALPAAQRPSLAPDRAATALCI